MNYLCQTESNEFDYDEEDQAEPEDEDDAAETTDEDSDINQ
jgi:hypothetical protein